MWNPALSNGANTKPTWPATIRSCATLRRRKNASAANLKRNRNEHRRTFTHHPCITFRRRLAVLATCRELGLLPERWARNRCADRSNFGAEWSTMMVTHELNGWDRLVLAVEYSTSKETRFWLALVAWIWFFSFLWPGRILNSEGFAWLGTVASENTWTVAWLLYATLKTWRLWVKTSPRLLTIAINSFGCILFITTAVATSIAVFPVPPIWPANCAFAIMSCWILFKTAFPHGL